MSESTDQIVWHKSACNICYINCGVELGVDLCQTIWSVDSLIWTLRSQVQQNTNAHTPKKTDTFREMNLKARPDLVKLRIRDGIK